LFYFSVVFTLVSVVAPVYPQTARASVTTPHPASPFLEVFNELVVLYEVLFYFSVVATLKYTSTYPPKLKAPIVVPHPANPVRASFIEVVVTQEDPFQISVIDRLSPGGP